MIIFLVLLFILLLIIYVKQDIKISKMLYESAQQYLYIEKSRIANDAYILASKYNYEGSPDLYWLVALDNIFDEHDVEEIAFIEEKDGILKYQVRDINRQEVE